MHISVTRVIASQNLLLGPVNIGSVMTGSMLKVIKDAIGTY